MFGVLLVFTAGTAYAGSSVGGSIGAVLGAVFGLTVSTLAEAARTRIDRSAARKLQRPKVFERWEEQRSATGGKSGQLVRSLPPGDDSPDAALSPATLLVPEQTVVPFIGREAELSELTAWCMGRSGPLWLLTGAGGTGKTRLAWELAARLTGWDCGWVRPGQEPNAIDVLRRDKSLIVVDYAETRARKQLAELIWELVWQHKHQVRVLLIARAAGDWWRELYLAVQGQNARKLVRNAGQIRLNNLERNGPDWNRQYTEAVQIFCERLGAGEPVAPMPVLGLSTPVLVVHVAALVAVLEPGDRFSRQNEVLTRLLEHEDRYWQWCAESCDLANLIPKVRRQSVALLCLTGADDPAALAGLLRRVPVLADATAERIEAVVAWLQMLYPGQQSREIGTLQPNLLAEHLVVQELAADSAFRRVLTNLPYPAARHAMTVLGRATRHSDEANAILREALAADVRNLARPAITAARETDGTLGEVLAEVVDAKPMSAKQLIEISEAIPPGSQSLHRAAIGVGKKLLEVESAQFAKADDNELAADLRSREDAVAEIERTAQLFRERAETEPDIFGPDLVQALRLLRDALADLGRADELAKITAEIERLESPGAQ